MLTKEDKVLKLYVPFDQKQIKNGEDDENLEITGHASTNDIDRSGDIIASDAWTKDGALDNYLKNPVILVHHDMERPIGRTIAHEIDSKGLKITASISKLAGSVVEFIKEGLLSAFSVGFMIKDAEFDPNSGIFMIKELELFEISVVSVPANQNTLFNVEKNFDSPEDYKEFRNQFIKSESEETLMDDKTTDKADNKPIDIAALAREISQQIKGDLKAEEKAIADAAKAEKETAERVEATAVTASERLIKDLREELVEKDTALA
jgi:HK97 family phage prohead protease